MKMRNELVAWKDTHNWIGPTHYITANTPSRDDAMSALSHDAMCAHALMQAMGELSHSKVLDFVKIRADELMREWTGFAGGVMAEICSQCKRKATCGRLQPFPHTPVWFCTMHWNRMIRERRIDRARRKSIKRRTPEKAE